MQEIVVNSKDSNDKINQPPLIHECLGILAKFLYKKSPHKINSFYISKTLRFKKFIFSWDKTILSTVSMVLVT